MLKRLLETYVKKTKNADFYFDSKVSSSLLLEFFFEKLWSLLRGLKVISITRGKKKVFLGRSVQMFNKKNIHIGNNVNIGDHVKLSALGSQPLLIGDNVNIGAFSQLVISTTFYNVGKYIRIGDNVGMGEFAYLGGAGGLSIGANTIIGQYFSTHPENHVFADSQILIREQGVVRDPISIGENCWIGSKVTILNGVTIGNGCVLAAGAVVTNSFPDNVVIGGVPARILKRIE